MTTNWNMPSFTIMLASLVLMGIGVVFEGLTYFSVMPDQQLTPVSVSSTIINDHFLEGCALTKVEEDGTKTCLLPHLRSDTL